LSKGAKLAYRPIGLIAGLIAGAISGAVFKQIWKLVAQQDDAPTALQSEYKMREVVIAAAIQGAIFAAVRSAADRTGAKAIERSTGVWPARDTKEKEHAGRH
jgi:hypothetical protein